MTTTINNIDQLIDWLGENGCHPVADMQTVVEAATKDLPAGYIRLWPEGESGWDGEVLKPIPVDLITETADREAVKRAWAEETGCAIQRAVSEAFAREDAREATATD